MIFFFHLFAGVILGLLIGDLLHDRRWIIPTSIGSVLPDLIDKTVGYLIFADMFGSGRLFLHSLVIAGILLLFGYLFWKYWGCPEILGVALGILLHQILDLMWEDPAGWVFPLFGFSPTGRGADYALTLLLTDLSSGSEKIFAIIIAMTTVLFLAFRYKGKILMENKNFWTGLLGAGAILFLILGGATIGIGLYPFSWLLVPSVFKLFRIFGWNEPFEFILGGGVFLMGAFVLWNMRLSLIQKQETSTDGS